MQPFLRHSDFSLCVWWLLFAWLCVCRFVWLVIYLVGCLFAWLCVIVECLFALDVLLVDCLLGRAAVALVDVVAVGNNVANHVVNMVLF